MPRRYPEYQEGGMPSQVPTDIQRLIKRMLEAKTDRAEEVIPDMAYGGIVGLQGGGVMEALRNIPRGMLDVPRRAIERIRERIPEGLGELISGDRFGEPGVDVIGPSKYPIWPHARTMDPDQFRERRGEILETLGNIPRGMVDVPRRAIEGIRERIPEGIRDRISEYAEENPPFGSPDWRPFASRVGEGSRLDPDQERRGIIPLLLDRIRGRAGGGVIGFQAGGNPYQQQMVQSYVSPEVAQPYADLTSRIQQVGAQPYTPYGGQRLAATTGDQALARAAYGAYGRGAGPAGTQQAAATMGQAGQMLGGAYQGMAGLQPQYAQMAGQFGQAAQGALGQAQAGAAGMQQLAGRAELQGQLAGAGMRQTGAAAQAQQQALGAGQAAQAQQAQALQQQLGAGQAAAGQAGQQQMAGLGAGMGAAGQAALATIWCWSAGFRCWCGRTSTRS